MHLHLLCGFMGNVGNMNSYVNVPKFNKMFEDGILE